MKERRKSIQTQHRKRKGKSGPPVSNPSGQSADWFNQLSDSSYLRESALVRGQSGGSQPALLPLSAATLWRKVKAGTFPAPKKLSTRVTAWKVGDLRAWINDPQ